MEIVALRHGLEMVLEIVKIKHMDVILLVMIMMVETAVQVEQQAEHQAKTVMIIITVLTVPDVSQIVVQIFAQDIIITTIIPVTVKVFAHGVLQMVSNIVLMDVIQMDA